MSSGGNVTCYHYDALHRLTSITYPSGPYASATPSKYFVYDSASISFNGTTTMANPKNRLVEAYTCTSCPGTKITDLAFSYSVRGETTDVYQSTPHSGGWYHVNGTYFANGALNTLSTNVSGLPTITYGTDGEGRVSTVTASSGQNPVSSTAYNYGSQVTDVTLGSGDSDHFTFDANTGRITQYKFTVGTTPQNVIGNLGWNANGSLGTLGITDPFNPANTQSCTYTHDDLSRITNTNCGSVWSQSFGFDPFGNITKSGSLSFQATYTTASNRIATIASAPNPTYDANGNLLTVTDGTSHSCTWDAEGKQVGIDTLTATYDALGRMVELNNSGTYTQTVYGLGSEKLALLNGTTLTKAFVVLPSGTAVYTASGLSYYRHSDWLGSARFASTTSRTLYASSAYAPFGEQYASSGNDQSFTGQQPDSTSGLYDFLFRRLSQTQGRWISPDPAGLAAVGISNPQTWNRYAYVGNTPNRAVDALGLDASMCDASQESCDGGTTWDGDLIEVGWGGGGAIEAMQFGLQQYLSNTSFQMAQALHPNGDGWTALNSEDYAGCWTNLNPSSRNYDEFWCADQHPVQLAGSIYVSQRQNGPVVADSPSAANSGTANYCSVLDPNCKNPGPLQNYLTFLGCEGAVAMNLITEEEDKGSKTAFGMINAWAIIAARNAIQTGKANWAGVTAVATAGAMNVAVMLRANQICTAAVYGKK